jgi:hypothetical protein
MFAAIPNVDANKLMHRNGGGAGLFSIGLEGWDAHRIQTTLEHDGTLTLRNVPFRAGETVDVIILLKQPPADRGVCSLRGTPVTYSDPFEPVGVDDWDAAR